MLLIDDDDELPLVAGAAEAALFEKLGADGIAAIDDRIMREVSESQQKVARVIHGAIEAGELTVWDEGCVELHARRVIALVGAGRIEAYGDTRKPRWSEVRRRG